MKLQIISKVQALIYTTKWLVRITPGLQDAHKNLQYKMKKTITLLGIIALLVSCKKKDPAPSTPTSGTCTINSAFLKDVIWHHLTGSLADLTFASNGIYFENSTNDGNWSLINNCDSIYVTRPSNSFYYKILSVTTDTLKINNPAFGQLTYFK